MKAFIHPDAPQDGLRRLAVNVLLRAFHDARQKRDLPRSIDARVFLLSQDSVLYAEAAGVNIEKVSPAQALQNFAGIYPGTKSKGAKRKMTDQFERVIQKHALNAQKEIEDLKRQTEADKQRQGQIDALTATLNVYAAEMQRHNQHPGQFTPQQRRETQRKFDEVYSALRQLGAVPPDRGNNSPRVKEDPIILERR